MYELNGDEYSLEQLQGAAEKYGMDFDSYLETMKKKGLVEKTQDVAATDAAVTSQPDTDLASENISLESQKLNHPSVDQLKEGISWFQAEGDMKQKLNTWYKGTGYEFNEVSFGKDKIQVYDSNTGEYSDVFDVPNAFRGKMAGTFEDLHKNLMGFFNREKQKNQEQLNLDKEFKKQREVAENKVADLLEDKQFMTDILGEDYSFKWIQRIEDGGKSGVGNDQDYQLIQKAIKEKVGDFEGGFLGLFKSYAPNKDISRLDEQGIEVVIKNAISKQFDRASKREIERAEVNLADAIKEENITFDILDNATLSSAIQQFSPEQKALYKSNQKIKDLEPGTKEYANELLRNEKLRKDTETFFQFDTERLIDPITGLYVNPEAPEAQTAMTFTKNEFDEIKSNIEKTHAQTIEQVFNANGRKRFMLNRQGEQMFDITVNDPQALAVFKKLGYEVKGDNKLGYELNVKLKHLARYYDATVNSDGFSMGIENPGAFEVDPEDQAQVGDDKFYIPAASTFMGLFGISDKSSFTSPMGYFGLTEKTDEQKFTLAEQRFFDQEEYAKDDKSKAFKRLIKDYRDAKIQNIKEGAVLRDMHLLNIDPASTKEILPTRGYEAVVEGFRGMFGGSEASTDIEFESKRKQRDVLETIVNTTDIKATESQKERFKRSGAYRVYEGVAGFIPAIAEFALIDVALKKTGAITGVGKLMEKASKGSAFEKTSYHTYMAIREEFKMAQAFEEHYHQGGGVGFYAVGTMLPKFKTGENLLNTFLTVNRSGFAGALSTQAAANLEALVRDVKGKETYQTYLNENYGDLDLKTQDFITDYFVFAMVGAKGFANKNFKNYFRTTSRLESLERELTSKIKSYEEGIKSTVTTEVGKAELKLKKEKAEDLLFGVGNTLNTIYKTADFQDPVKVKKILDRQKRNLKDVFNKEIEFEVVSERFHKDGRRRFEFDDSAAEFKADGKTIIVDVNRITEGKVPHEVTHFVMKKVFENNPEQLMKFKKAIEGAFPGKHFVDIDVKDKNGKLTGEKRNMSLNEFIENEYGKSSESLKANEFLAYTAELLANPRFYANHTKRGTWKRIKDDINKFTNRRLGQSVFENNSKQDMIDFLYNFSRSIKSGTLTFKQVEMFKKIKEDGTFGEPIEMDSRTPSKIKEQASEDYTMPSKVVEMSAKTQQTYDAVVKGKKGKELKEGIERLIMPDFTNETSVAGKQFDGIIYDVIKKLYPRIAESKTKSYNLAVDLVYDTNRPNPATTKNRGLIGIINEYEARKEFGTSIKKEKGQEKEVKDIFDSEGNKRLTEEKVKELEKKYNAKFGTSEFIEQAKAEGYKGKQNLTKTVSQLLSRRIHKIAEQAGFTESEFQGMEFGKSIDDISEAQLADLGGGFVEAKTPKQKTKQERIEEYKLETKLDLRKHELFKDNVELKAETQAAALKFLTEAESLNDVRRENYRDAYKKFPKAFAEFKKQFGENKEQIKETFEKQGKDLFKGILLDKDYITGEKVTGIKKTFDTLFKGTGVRMAMSEFGELAKVVRTAKERASGPEKFEKIDPKGENVLYNKIYGTGRPSQHKTRADRAMQFLFESYFNQTLRLDRLNNPGVVEMLKKKSPGVYEAMGFENAIAAIKTTLKGTVPETMASKARLRLAVDELGRKIRNGAGAKAATLEIISKYEDLKPYKQQILESMRLIEPSETVTGTFIKVGEGMRTLGLIKGKAFEPIVFDAGYKPSKGKTSIFEFVNKFAEEAGIPKELLNINEKFTDRTADPIFSKQYAEEFLPEFFNSFDVRLLKNIENIIRPTMGEGMLRFGYRPLVDNISSKTGEFRGKRPMIFNAEMGKGIMQGLNGVKENLPFDYKFIKVNNNSTVKTLLENTLKDARFEDIATSEGKAKIAKYVKEKLSPDGTVKGYEKMLKANEGMLKYTSGKIFDYLNNAKTIEQKAKAINNIAYMLQAQTSRGPGIFRGLASHTAVTLKSVLPTIKKKYHSEHEFQLANFAGNILISALRNTGNKSKFVEEANALTRVYKQSIIEKTLQERIDKEGNTTSVYSEKHINTDVTAKYEFMKERQIMESTLDLRSGKTYDQLADNIIEGSQAAKAINRLAKVNLKKAKAAGLPSKNVTITENLENKRIRDEAYRKGRLKNKNPRGMSTFDFDETLIDKGKNFIIATKGKETVKISSGEWPIKGPEFAEAGYKFDFTDFVNVRGGVEGPLFKKFKERLAKFGPENMYILTARPAEAATAIHGWLKSKGVEIPLENITGLGNSTGEAKALWMLEKFSEGYNDMYFVDDALPNVKAVRDVLNQLDIKSDVQQALASKNFSLEVNKILEHSLGIESQKRFSKAEGKVRGRNVQRRRLFIPDSAADFELLLEPLYGKGKKGVENKKWFQDNIVKQFERGINDYNKNRQAVTTDYMALRKRNKDVVKLLNKEVPGTSFTHDMAMRVYIWNKAGLNIPDLAATSQKKLVEFVINNPKLRSYAESLARLTRIKSGLKEPGENWWAETIATEISDVGRGSSRAEFLSDFIERKKEIFSEENLNKMESKLGPKWRDSIEDMLDRMETGRTRAENLSGPTRALMTYLNGSVGAIMNFNTRSGTLQLISSVNFINSSFNNPLRAAAALANTKQYAKDFMFIMNSDMLKQRRQGLQINVTEAEIASAASGKNPAKAIMAKILKAGYIPTKFADSFAIASGGATFYRNAIKKYMKEGMSEAEASKKAFVDFQAIAERTQQSSRADLISKQQTTLAGRFILPFANTPMQMNRIMMKNYLDIYKGRYKGFYGENSFTQKLSNIGYYGFLQSLIFAGLQSAGFAVFANSDDDELKAKKKTQILDGISTSFLRGMGIQGAVLDGVIKSGLEFHRQREKGRKADYSEIGEKLLNISPPVGSKISKLDAAGNSYFYNKNIIEDKPFQFGLEDPALRTAALTIEATTNYPLNRHVSKLQNIENALDNDYSALERFMSLMGWSVWGTNPKKAKEKELDLTGEGGGSSKSMTKSMTKQF
jgi:hypothetical protein